MNTTLIIGVLIALSVIVVALIALVAYLWLSSEKGTLNGPSNTGTSTLNQQPNRDETVSGPQWLWNKFVKLLGVGTGKTVWVTGITLSIMIYAVLFSIWLSVCLNAHLIIDLGFWERKAIEIGGLLILVGTYFHFWKEKDGAKKTEPTDLKNGAILTGPTPRNCIMLLRVIGIRQFVLGIKESRRFNFPGLSYEFYSLDVQIHEVKDERFESKSIDPASKQPNLYVTVIVKYCISQSSIKEKFQEITSLVASVDASTKSAIESVGRKYTPEDLRMNVEKVDVNGKEAEVTVYSKYVADLTDTIKTECRALPADITSVQVISVEIPREIRKAQEKIQETLAVIEAQELVHRATQKRAEEAIALGVDPDKAYDAAQVTADLAEKIVITGGSGVLPTIPIERKKKDKKEKPEDKPKHENKPK